MQTCVDCWRRRPAFDRLRAAYFFEGPLRVLIHRLKYRRAKHLAAPLATLLVGTTAGLLPADAIVPVPLHPRRLRERGFNQAALLATELSQHLHIPLIPDCLERIRDTPPQMRLPAIERRRNVRGAFACHDPRLRGQTIIVLDDVCTTGATLEACAVALKKSGSAAVFGVAIARAR